MKNKQSILGVLVVTAMMASGSAFAGEKFSDAERLFTVKVKGIFADKCNGCHGDDPEKIKGDFNMLTREKLLAGGETMAKQVLVPGDAAKSFLMETIRWTDPDFEMPPKENDRLSKKQIEDVEKWIAAGAPWPDEIKQAEILKEESKQKVTDEGMIVENSGGLSDDWTYRRYQPEDIWSFLPVEKPALPEQVTSQKRSIDFLIRKKQREVGVEPAPQADPLTLLRRVTFDLIGLPATPEEAKAFLIAWESDANQTWNDTIDRLLDSPHYGERWAQHWLDVVRYADTAGFSNDWERSNAWRYRDYVVRALNADKPWNRFILEQLAGDELEPDNSEMKVAVGFLRMGPWEHTAMSPDVESRQQYLDDVTNVVGQAFMSTTMRCAKCHDHKFDPLPTRDYYRMYAAFATTQPAEIKADFLPKENKNRFESDRKHVEELLAYAKKGTTHLYAKREAAAKKWYEERGLEYKNEQTRRPLKEKKPARFVGLSTIEEGELKVREQDVKIWTRALERHEPMAQAVYNGGDLYPASQKLRLPNYKAKKQANLSAVLPEAVINSGGSINAKGEKVTPGVISALGLRTYQGTDEDPYRLQQGMNKRRLSLARWIAHRDNALTTRSIANRIWHYHFGKGIARNPNNFGGTGGKPTNPALLDFLAATFVEDGWSLKKMHKRILTSRTWMQSSDHPKMEELQAKDPNNELLAVFDARRLTAEELRDSMLANTAELNREIGGLPVKPEMNREVALSARMIQFSLAPAYQASRTPEERNRRSIYARRFRGLPDPMLDVFNKPNADDSCEKRDAPSVTPQVFTMLNGEVATNRSIAFALRLEKEGEQTSEQISRAFEIAFNRNPSPAELEKLDAHYSKMLAYHSQHQPVKIEHPTQITRSLIEEFSGDSFEYEELLNAYKDYTSDALPSEVKPATRALADIALLIFNSNEYLFVY